MILSDFLMLESYFLPCEAAQTLEDCACKYGAESIEKCLKNGNLACRKIAMGPDAGKTLLFLSEKGREHAATRGII